VHPPRAWVEQSRRNCTSKLMKAQFDNSNNFIIRYAIDNRV